MTYQASHRFARISPRKARLVADLVRGESIEQAIAALDFSKRRGAYFLRGVLKSAGAAGRSTRVHASDWACG